MGSALTLWILSVILTCYITTSLDECSPGTSRSFRLELYTSWCANHVSWSIKDVDSDNVVLFGGPYDSKHFTLVNETYCLASEECFEFIIEDLYGDGDSSYNVFYNDDLLKSGKSFGSKDRSIPFGGACPISMASNAPTRSPMKTMTKSPEPQKSSSPTIHLVLPGNGNNDGIIIGGTIGGFVGLAILVAAFYAVYSRGKRQRLDSGRVQPPSQISIS